MSLKARIARLERRFPPPQAEDESDEELIAVFRALGPRHVARFLAENPDLSDAIEAPATEAFGPDWRDRP